MSPPGPDEATRALDDTTGRAELYSPEFFADPASYYGSLRKEDPVFWQEETRTWIVTGHHQLDEVLKQPKRFSARLAALDQHPPSPPIRPEDGPLHETVARFRVQEFIQMDPPDHAAKRAPFAHRFSAGQVEALRSWIRTCIDSLLDDVSASGGMDVVSAVARPLPLLVIARMMGVPEEEAPLIAEQARKRMASVLSLDDDRLQLSVDGFRETEAYLRHALGSSSTVQPAGCPVRDDVLGDIFAARESGAFSTEEAVANAMLLIDAGHETTAQLVANATLALLQRPDQWDLLRSDPKRYARGAVEETLRFDPPLQALRRVAATDGELGGHGISAGDRILGVITSANRDPMRFPDPERFDLRREPNRHLAFGGGVHLCLGRHLARLEGEEYLVALAERFPTAELALNAPPRYHSTPRVRSLSSLQIRWP